MQLSLFEDVTNNYIATEYVTRHIIHSDSVRNYIKQAINDNNRNELIKLFQESINTYGFGEPNGYMWCRGLATIDNEEYKITARELADMALKIYGEDEANEMSGLWIKNRCDRYQADNRKRNYEEKDMPKMRV